MWSLLTRRCQVLLVMGAGFAGVHVLQVLYGLLSKPISTWGAVSLVATAIVGVGALLVDMLWPWLWSLSPALQRMTFPNLNGKWQGTVQPAPDPQTGRAVPPIEVEVEIRQGLLNTVITMQTRESTSYSTRSWLERFPERGSFRVWYSYSNDPQAQYRQRSSPHEGVGMLEMGANDLQTITGRYYTDRRTTGDVSLTRVRSGYLRKNGQGS